MKILISLYLFIVVILTQFFAAYFYTKARVSHRKAFSALTVCISVYLFGYLMIINAANPEEMIFWNQVQYLGIPFIPVLWLLVALFYTKTVCTVRRWLMVSLFFVPVLTFFIRFTNPWHHLFYKSFEMGQVFGFFTLCMERGGWYYVNISYTLLCLFLTAVIFYLGYTKHQIGYSLPQFLLFLIASLLPLIGVLSVFLFYEKWAIDYAALLMPVALLMISYSIFKYDFWGIKILARETIFENSTIGMVILEPGPRIIDYNKTAKKLFDALNVSLDGHRIIRVLKGNKELVEVLESELTRDFLLTINGEERFFEVESVRLGGSKNGDGRLLKYIRDVTERKLVQEKLKSLATVDALTGLYNRAEFMELAQKELAFTKRYNGKLALLMMDLDHFKAVNDTLGHGAGDEVLRELGRLIKSSFRKTDISGRVGGEEFAVVLKKAPPGEAVRVAEKFRKTVEDARVMYEGREIRVTISIGVSATFNAKDDLENILKEADTVLYEAKAKGRNCVVLFKK